MRRARLDSDRITRIAVAVVDDDGFDALSLSAVAERLGVGPSALYSHVNGLDGLRRLVAVHAMNSLVSRVREAAIGVSGPDAVRSVSDAYRGFARAHPGQFRFAVMPPADDPELAAADDELLNVFALVYRGAGLDPGRCDRAARGVRSAIHGFVTLEMTARPTPAQETHYRELLEMVAAVFPARPGRRGGSRGGAA